MASMLRYVRCVTRLNNVGWKVTSNQQVLTAGRKLIFQNDQHLFESYATTASKSKFTAYANTIKFQQFEDRIKKYGTVSKIDLYGLIDEIQELGNISSLDALLLIRSCGRALYEASSEESINLVKKLWDKLNKLKTPLDVSHFNALLSVYIEKNYDFSPDDFLLFMEQQGIPPNRVTYQRLIKQYCQKGDIEGATRILEIMKHQDMPLTEDVFNSLILGHAEANDMESALKIVDVMTKAEILPSANTYTEIMCAYAKRGDLESILKTLSEVKNDILYSESNYLEIYFTLVTNGHKDKAESFLNEMPEIRSDSEVCRYLIKLICANHEDLALKLLIKSSENLKRQKFRANTFIRTMIINQIPIEKVIQICQYFDRELQFNRSYLIALYNVFVHNLKLDSAFSLLQACKETDQEIREHYFWPLLVAEAKSGNIANLKTILTSMIEEYKIIPTEETLKNYILPHMFGTWDHTVSFFQSLKIPNTIIYNSIASRLLFERQINTCAKFVCLYPGLYSKDILLHSLVEALNVKDSYQAFITILRNISENSEPADPDHVPVSLVDAALRKVMSIIPEFRSNILVKLLDELVATGLSISPEVATEIRDYLQNSFVDDVEESLQKLSSGNLKIVPQQIYDNSSSDINSEQNIMNMKRIINLRRDFWFFKDQNNVEKAYNAIQQLQAVGYRDVGIYAQAVRLFCENKNLIAAEKCMTYLQNTPEVKIDISKILNYVQLLIENDRFNDAIDLLTKERDADDVDQYSKVFERNVRQLLQSVANKEDPEKLSQLFNLLESKKYLIPNNYVLGPIVKCYLSKEGPSKAVEAYEDACKKYKCTPYKNVLLKYFIEKEDPESLQKITDLTAEIHGENNALIDLGFAFLECGKLKQAQKIFETPGLKIRNVKISSVIDYLEKHSAIESLYALLIEVTKRVPTIDRSFMYDNILKVCLKKNDWQAGLTLWTSMQEDNIHPSSYFVNMLNTLLLQNNQSSPFAINVKDRRQQDFQNDEIEEAIKEKKYDHAEKLFNQLTTRPSILKCNKLIIDLLERNELDRAYKIAKTLVTKYNSIGRNSFYELTRRLIEARRYQEVKDFVASLSQPIKAYVNYNRVLNSIQVIEHGLKYFCDNFKSSDATIKDRYIPSETILFNLLNNPENLDEYEVWAKEMYKSGFQKAMRPLWCYYFIVNDHKEAETFNEYLSNDKGLLIRPITETALERKDPEMLKRLIKRIETNKMLNEKKNFRKTVYCELIKLYLALNCPEDAFNALSNYQKSDNISNIPQELINQLRKKYEKTGKKLPLFIDVLSRNQQDEQPELSSVAKAV